MSASIKDYRKQLEPDDIINILKKLDIDPVWESASAITYPTVCHNADGGSHKLYYYKKDHVFKCYTQCDEIFDIFQLIINIYNLRDGVAISLRQAMAVAGIETTEEIDETEFYSIKKQLDYLFEMNNTIAVEPQVLKEYSKNILNRYIYDLEYLKPWINEGISPQTLGKYSVKFDTTINAIVIPYFTDDKKLVGIRGRFLGSDAVAKYMPIQYQGEYLAHPTSQILYGLDITKEALQKHKMAVVYEGEKSVLKMDTIYGRDNVSVAVSGKNISREHIQLLLQYGVKEVVLAFDRDYISHNELNDKIKEYEGLVQYMKNFFNVSILVDYDFVLPHKESPIDMGKEVFEQLMQDRVYL